MNEGNHEQTDADTVGQYLHEIGMVELLKAPQE